MGSCLLTTRWQAHPQVLSCCHMLQCVQESLLSARVQICFVLQAQTQHMAAANGGHFRENLSLFWESYVIKCASETQLVDVTFSCMREPECTCLWSITSPATHWHVGVLPQGHRRWSMDSDHGSNRELPASALSTAVRDCISVTPLLLFFRV